MEHQVICNVYRDYKALQGEIQYYLDLYGEDAKIVVKITPTLQTVMKQDGGIAKLWTEYLLTLLIFEKAKFRAPDRE